MILFVEDRHFGYKERTLKNATADVTLAFAVDFTTAGEKLTRAAVLKNGKTYIPINIHRISSELENVVNKLSSLKNKSIVVNIAGNGIYTLIKCQITQAHVDSLIHEFLVNVIKMIKTDVSIIGIRTGGQTGIDEAGAKAGSLLSIPTLILAPRGWRFRNELGVDISDELLFKNRFNEYIK